MSYEMDKPVHKVLEDYDLLNVSVIQNSNTINMTSAMLWRMNLCAVSEEIPCTFFVAMNYRVNVYTIDTIHSPFKDPKISLISPNARRTGGGSESPFVINAIKVSRILEKEILVTVSENGEVCIWRTDSLHEPPMVINNEVSTWGIAIHAEQGLIAVSANSWKITIFNIVEMTKDNPIFGQRSRREPDNVLKSQPKIELIGHQDNIPNIDFNESGRYLASSSIDQTCKVWDIATQEVVTQRPSAISDVPGQALWCWSVKFIKPGCFKYAVCVDKIISQAYMQRVYQGRSTSLSNLGLCHSASSPIFPMNIASIDDLLEQDEVDFSMYNNPNISDNIWDDDLLREEEDFMEEMYELRRQQVYNNQTRDDETNDQISSSYSNLSLSNPSIPQGGSLSLGMQEAMDNEVGQSDDLNLRSEENELERGVGSSEEDSYSGDISPDRFMNDNDEFVESPEEQEINTNHRNVNSNVWNTRNRYPTRADWALSIIDDHTHVNRDGWGDEIVSEMRNSSIDEPEDTTFNRLIREHTLSENTPENIPIFVSSNSSNSSWGNNSDENYATADEDLENAVKRPSYCIPNAMKRSTSSINRLEEEQKSNRKLNPSLGEYLMISTGKDIIMMSTNKPKMSRIRAERNVINKVDVRIDEMLSILDRINMVEWLPELELFVAASQKGTVALMRILQVEFEDGEQGCIFNNECYLPTDVFQTTPLYGMTVKRVKPERFSPVTYQIFLFYYSGNVLGYTISRKDSGFLVENLIL